MSPASPLFSPRRQRLSLALALAASLPAHGAPTDAASWLGDTEFSANWGLAAINAHLAYARGLDGTGIGTALFEPGGVAMDHPDLRGRGHGVPVAGRLPDGSPCAPSPWLGGPGACFADEGLRAQVRYLDWDSELADGMFYPDDEAWLLDNVAYGRYDAHGSHVAGIMAAARDGQGMQGVAPASQLHAVRLQSDAYRDMRDFLGMEDSVSLVQQIDEPGMTAAYETLRARGVRVVNHSWGMGTPPVDTATVDRSYEEFKDGVAVMARPSLQHGLLQVVAAGNFEGMTADLTASLPRYLPGLEPYWLSVVDLQQDDTLSDGSSICGLSRDWCVAAPGNEILSTVLEGQVPATPLRDAAGDVVGLEVGQDSPRYGHAEISGTSMAAPHVTGALALLMQRFPYLDNAQVRDVLLTTATDLGEPGVDERYGWGKVDLGKAIDGPGQLRVDTRVVMDRRGGGLAVWDAPAWDEWRNDIGGPGRLVKAGEGWLRLAGDNTFAGAQVEAGTLELRGSNQLDGAVQVERAGHLHVSGELLGSALRVDGGRAVIEGLLQAPLAEIGGGGVLAVPGELRGDLALHGASALIDGRASVTSAVADGGALLHVLPRGRFEGGALQLHDAQARIDGQLQANLRADGDSLLEVAGTLRGEVMLHGGQARIDGQVQAPRFDLDAGATLQLPASGRIEGGALALGDARAVVDGVVASTVALAPGAQLSGNGRLGTTRNAGTLSPGHSIGQLSIDGDYVQLPGATYLAELEAPDRADRLQVGGSAQLAGTLQLRPLGTGYRLGQRYRVLEAAGGVSGAFAALDAFALTPFLGLRADYLPQAVEVLVDRGLPLASAADTDNQRAVAVALDRDHWAQPLPQALTQSPSAAVARAAFDQLSGELHAGSRALLLQDSQRLRDAALARAGDDGFVAQAPGADGAGLWADVQQQRRQLDGDGNARAARLDGSSLLIGADHRFAGGSRLGALIGTGKSDIGLAGSVDHARVRARYAGVYGGWQWRGWELRGGIGQAWQALRTERAISLPVLGNEHAHADYDSDTSQAFLELGHRWEGRAGRIAPFARYAWLRQRSDSAGESGGPAALQLAGDSARVGLLAAGMRAALDLRARGQQQSWLSLGGALAWQQARGDRRPGVLAHWQDGPDFTVHGAPLAERGLLVDLAVRARLGADSLLEFGYHGAFGDGADDLALSARYSLRF